MTRNVTVGVLMAAVLAVMAAGVSAAEKTYDLAKVPKFRVGDQVASDELSDLIRTITVEGDKVARSNRDRKHTRQIFEVLEVDSAGRIMAFRRTIVRSDLQASGTAGGKLAYKKPVAIERIHFVGRRKGLTFQPDTTTVVGGTTKKLKASQIGLLKQYCKPNISFGGYSEVNALLMPAAPVAVGQTWKPKPAALKKWFELRGEPKATEYKPIGSTFRLASVKGDAAVVQGVVIVEMAVAGKKVRFPLKLAAKVDTKSGRWLQRTMTTSFTIKFPQEKAALKLEGNGKESFAFIPGKGQATKLPAKVFDLGWQPPGKDTNGYKDLRHGFSLSVPKDFVPQAIAPGRKDLARFINPAKAQISVRSRTTDRPSDIEDYASGVPPAIRKRLTDYRVTGTKEITLANNVPALVLIGRFQQDKFGMVTLVAVEGSRVVTVSTAYPSSLPDIDAKMQAAATSLRLFQEDAGKTSPAPRAPAKPPAPPKPKPTELEPVEPKPTTDP